MLKILIILMMAFTAIANADAQTPSQIEKLQAVMIEPPRVVLNIRGATSIIINEAAAVAKVCEMGMYNPTHLEAAMKEAIATSCDFSKLVKSLKVTSQKINDGKTNIEFSPACSDCSVKLFDFNALISGNWSENLSADMNDSGVQNVRNLIVTRALAKKAIQALQKVARFYSRSSGDTARLTLQPYSLAFFSASTPLNAAVAYFDALNCEPSDNICLSYKELWGAYIARILKSEQQTITPLIEDYNHLITDNPKMDIQRWQAIKDLLDATAQLDSREITYKDLATQAEELPAVKTIDRALEQLTRLPIGANREAYVNASSAVVSLLQIQDIARRDLNFSIYESTPINLKLWPNFEASARLIRDSLNDIKTKMIVYINEDGQP